MYERVCIYMCVYVCVYICIMIPSIAHMICDQWIVHYLSYVYHRRNALSSLVLCSFHIHTYTHIHIHTHTYTHIISLFLYLLHITSFAYVCVLCVCVCVSVCVCVCVDVCVCVYICHNAMSHYVYILSIFSVNFSLSHRSHLKDLWTLLVLISRTVMYKS